MPEARAGADTSQQQPNVDQDTNADQNKEQARVYKQDEVDRITKKVRENARRDTELRLRREHEARQASGGGGGDGNRQQPKAEEDPEPKRDDFDTHEDYQRSVTRWDARQESKKAVEATKKEEREKAAREEADKVARTWHTKIEKVMSELSDFETVLETEPETLELVRRAPMRHAITESDIGPRIVYELCKNPAEAKRIAALPAYKQAAEIVKIEDKLLAAAAPKPKEGEGDDDPGEGDDPKDKGAERNADGTFKAPPKKEAPKAPPEPIEPGSGRSATSSAEPSDKDDADTWRRKELARMKRKQSGS